MSVQVLLYADEAREALMAGVDGLADAAKTTLGPRGRNVVGADCLRRALEEPMCQIAQNAGFEGAVVVETVRRLQEERAQPGLGFDAVRGEYRDMVDAGIVDPAKVTHAALEAAVSVASMMLTTEAMVSEEADAEGTA